MKQLMEIFNASWLVISINVILFALLYGIMQGLHYVWKKTDP